jgi:hypothetical protein
MWAKSRLEAFMLVSCVAVTRFVFRSHQLYDLDSVDFALGLRRFDPRTYQPHPPGYFLYVLMGRLINWVMRDANLSLVLLSIAASCGTVYLIYRLAFDWFGRGEARFAGLLFLFSPLGWFHGLVALTYSVEAFFSTLIGYLCWRIQTGNRALIMPTGVVLGLSAGIRPSSLLFLGPLYLYSVRRTSLKRRLAGVGVLLLLLSSWFIPMIWASGGMSHYFGALVSLWRLVPSHNTVFNSSPATTVARAFTVLFIYFLSFGAASIAPLVRTGGVNLDHEKKFFIMAWVTPALVFFTFIFLKFVNSGYLLLIVGPACIWLGACLSQWYRSSTWPGSAKLTVIGLSAAVNVLIFLVSPFYCSYRSVARFEAELEQVKAALPMVGSANDTMVVGFDSHFLGYRHAAYYLPEYMTVEYPEVKLMEGTRIFAMQDRQTTLLEHLPSARYQKFVLVPLPGGEPAYRKYLEDVVSRFPKGSLKTVRVGGVDFITGPTAALPILFPRTELTAEQGVYPLRH